VSEIYIVTNSVNEKRYVGQTTYPLSERWSAHKCMAKRGRSKSLLHKAIRKYGAASFVVEPLACVNGEYKEQVLNDLETFCIAFLKTRHTEGGYNLAAGGESCSGFVAWNKGKTLTAEQKEKIKAARAKQVITPEHRAAISASMKGRTPKNFSQFRGTGAVALRGKPWSAARRAAQQGVEIFQK
jgi:group I intron endonuclease